MRRAIITFLLALALPAFASAASIAAPNTNALGSGLVGYWSLDGDDTSWTTGTIYDLSGQGNHLAIASFSTTTSPVAGRIGQALKFNGASSYLRRATLGASLGSSITVCAWIKTSYSGGDQMIWSIDRNGSSITNEGIFKIIGGKLRYWDYTGAAYGFADAAPDGGTSVTDGRWHEVCFSKSGTAGTFYVDGRSDGTKTAATNVSYAATDNVIGSDYRGGNLFFNGVLDDVRLYNRALSSTDIALLYAAGRASVGVSAKNALTSGLVGYWTFDGADIGTSIADRSGNGFNGYLVGTNNSTSTRKVTGRLGQGFSFGGQTTGGVNVGSSSTLDPSRFTVAAWVYINSTYTYNYIFSNARDCCSPYNGIDFNVGASGTLIGRIDNSTTHTVTSGANVIPSGAWTHVAFSYDGSNMRLYTNGKLISTTANTTDPGTPASFNSYIGSMGNGVGSGGNYYTLNGRLDDVRVYSRALSDAEVAQLYASGVPADVAHSVSGNSGGSLSNGLIGYWTFDGSNINWKTGVAMDSSGNGNNGTLFNLGTTTAPTQGKVGQALKFNDTSSYVSVPSSGSIPTGSSARSVCLWMYTTSASWVDNSNSVFEYGTSNTRQAIGFDMYSYPNMQFYTWADDAVVDMGVPQTGWFHVCFTYDGATTFYIYSNGALKNTHTLAGVLNTSSTALNIGRSSLVAGYFNGKIDDVRIYNRLLSATEVKQLYQAGR